MEENNLDTRLEILLTTKTFGQLSAEEKNYASGFLSEEEYEAYSLLLSRSKNALASNYDTLQPPAETLQRLKQAFADKAIAKKTDTRFFEKPLYQGLAASVLLVILIGSFINLHLGGGQQGIADNKLSKHQIDQRIKKETLSAQTKKTRYSAWQIGNRT